MRLASISLSVCCSIGLLSAQHTPFEGPTEGVTFDTPTRSFRTITGSLGTAFLGPTVLLDFEYGSVAPQKNYGLAFRDGRCFLVSSLDSQQASTAVVPDCFNRPEDVAWSADGSTAVLYSRTQGWIQVFAGLPNSLAPNNLINVSPGSYLTGVTASSDGVRIAVGITGDTPGIYELAKDQILGPILPVANPTALAFSRDAATLYSVDTASSQVFELNMADMSSQSWHFDGLSDPIAIQPSRNAVLREVIYIAGGSDRTLLVYDAASHESIAAVQLDFVPVVMVPLGQHSFLLRPRLSQDEPLWSLGNDSPPAVYFTPAAPLTASGGLQ